MGQAPVCCAGDRVAWLFHRQQNMNKSGESGLISLGARRPTAMRLSERFLECHERIRRFLRIAYDLATKEAPEAEVVMAARSLHRYFGTALPLHVADEDESLLPRLPKQRAATAVMHREHLEMEAIIESLCDDWGDLAAEPGRTLLARSTEDRVERLQKLMERHLAAEERDILPHADRLPLEVQAEIVAEMQGRRQGT